MHRYIMNCPDGMVIDHIDGNKLKNIRSNLRICDSNNNRYNQRPQENRLSKYKGVIVREGRFIARISKDKQLYHLGSFNDEVACANCYNHFALKLFGEFARLNEVLFMDFCEWKSHQMQIIGSSKYIGVSIDKRTGKWESYIWEKKKKHFLGYHNTEKDAVIARNLKIIELCMSENKLQEVIWDE